MPEAAFFLTEEDVPLPQIVNELRALSAVASPAPQNDSPPPPPSPSALIPSGWLCSDACGNLHQGRHQDWSDNSNDGVCRPGDHPYDWCPHGTDCTDCGPQPADFCVITIDLIDERDWSTVGVNNAQRLYTGARDMSILATVVLAAVLILYFVANVVTSTREVRCYMRLRSKGSFVYAPSSLVTKGAGRSKLNFITVVVVLISLICVAVTLMLRGIRLKYSEPYTVDPDGISGYRGSLSDTECEFQYGYVGFYATLVQLATLVTGVIVLRLRSSYYIRRGQFRKVALMTDWLMIVLSIVSFSCALITALAMAWSSSMYGTQANYPNDPGNEPDYPIPAICLSPAAISAWLFLSRMRSLNRVCCLRSAICNAKRHVKVAPDTRYTPDDDGEKGKKSTEDSDVGLMSSAAVNVRDPQLPTILLSGVIGLIALLMMQDMPETQLLIGVPTFLVAMVVQLILRPLLAMAMSETCGVASELASMKASGKSKPGNVPPPRFDGCFLYKGSSDEDEPPPPDKGGSAEKYKWEHEPVRLLDILVGTAQDSKTGWREHAEKAGLDWCEENLKNVWLVWVTEASGLLPAKERTVMSSFKFQQEEYIIIDRSKVGALSDLRGTLVACEWLDEAKGSISQKSSEDVKAAPAAEGDWGAPKLDKLANQLAEAMTDAVAYAGEKAGPKDEFKKLRCEYFLSRMRKAEPELKKLLDDKGAQGKGHWLSIDLPRAPVENLPPGKFTWLTTTYHLDDKELKGKSIANMYNIYNYAPADPIYLACTNNVGPKERKKTLEKALESMWIFQESAFTQFDEDRVKKWLSQDGLSKAEVKLMVKRRFSASLKVVEKAKAWTEVAKHVVDGKYSAKDATVEVAATKLIEAQEEKKKKKEEKEGDLIEVWCTPAEVSIEDKAMAAQMLEAFLTCSINDESQRFKAAIACFGTKPESVQKDKRAIFGDIPDPTTILPDKVLPKNLKVTEDYYAMDRLKDDMTIIASAWQWVLGGGMQVESRSIKSALSTAGLGALSTKGLTVKKRQNSDAPQEAEKTELVVLNSVVVDVKMKCKRENRHDPWRLTELTVTPRSERLVKKQKQKATPLRLGYGGNAFAECKEKNKSVVF